MPPPKDPTPPLPTDDGLDRGRGLHAVCSRVIAAQAEATYRAAVEQGRALRPDGP